MNNVKKNFIYNTSYQLLTILIPIVTTPYITRTLGPEKSGDFSFANAITYYFIMFIMLGLNNYGNRTVAKVRDDKKNLSRNFFEIYGMQLVLGIFVTALYFMYCALFSNNILSWIMMINVVSAIIDINWLYFGLEKFKLTVSRSILIKIITTISVFVFVKKPDDVVIYALILSIGTLASNICLWYFLKREISYTKVKINDIFKHIKPNLVLFIPIVAISLYKYMDKIMLGILSDKSNVGFYDYSEKILQIPMALVNSLATIMLPHMSNIVANSNSKDEKKYIEISLEFSMFLTSSLCFGLMGISKEFVPFFYGDGYEACINIFYILLPSCCFVAFASVIRTQYLIPHNKDSIYIISVCIGALINISFNILFIPIFQALGAAIGTIFAEFSVCLYQSNKAKSDLEISKYIRNSIPFLLSGSIMFIVLLQLPFYKNDFITMMYKIVIGIIVYFAIFICVVKVFNKDKYQKYCSYIFSIKNSIIKRKI